MITKIHNKYYDLTNFKHPGGPICTALADGRDGTELFESHHLFTSKNMEEILSYYEVQHPDVIKSSGVFDWEGTKSDPFTIELQEAARKAIGKNIKATTHRFFELLVLFFVAMTQMYFFIKGEWYTMFTMPLTFWVFAVNIFHDASHFALSRNW